ncbi:hypothetical protein J7I93_00350 [Bacillus sp. ISL-47]|uniref:hypothetical protein n=1 Tax=Bacillus sp. ISL-47 TaxID=2819130 RepID=UPI001BEB1ADB|nr:hypothetical protein [Bacillus sp. ISL-47]MBT2686626.1 hypothetical protein [Bacillus sp. ISL-47]MBT2707018.1 hypothetical protein [Pseudomonas sp. ISL-84]
MIKLVVWSIFIIPWVSLFFLNQSVLRRYMPVALLATVLNTIVAQLAWTYNWWEFKETLFSWDKIAPLFTVYSIFLAGTIWIFYFTFRKFWLYFIVNIIVDLFYGFVFTKFLNSLHIRENGSFSPMANLLAMTILAVLLYIYQLWQEGNTDKVEVT